MEYRRATPMDVDGIYEVAVARSREYLLKSGANEESLSRTGFLLYPLAASEPNKPNYLERINLSQNFWVAEEAGEIHAFLMAYTLHEMLQITQKTDNDQGVLAYFLDELRFAPDTLYGMQIARSPTCRHSGVTVALVETILSHNLGQTPAMIGEIAQAPVKNEASTRLFESTGFRLLFHRAKDNGTRLSGVFVKTL